MEVSGRFWKFLEILIGRFNCSVTGFNFFLHLSLLHLYFSVI
jgi:hypothetical protein